MENSIIIDYKNGLSSIKISKKYKISKKKVLNILKENNIQTRKTKIELTPSQENKIIELYRNNVENDIICKELNVCERKIYETLLKFNIKKKSRNKITDEEKNKICSDFLKGLTFNEILKKYSIKNECTIYSILKSGGIKTNKIPHNKTPELIKNEIINKYVNGENICELHEKYGFGTTTIARWIKEKGVTRTLSDAFTLSAIKGRKHFRGTNLPWYSTKMDKWYVADSIWEAVRMEQLDNDNSVCFWEKSTDRIKYSDKNGKQHYYIPDFKIIYTDKKIVVEEIKPKILTKLELNILKFNAAKLFYNNKNIEYKIITENEIGEENIKNFNPENFIKYTKEIREKRRKELRKIRKNKKSEKNNNNRKSI